MTASLDHQSKAVSCDTCGKVLKNGAGLIGHMMFAHRVNPQANKLRESGISRSRFEELEVLVGEIESEFSFVRRFQLEHEDDLRSESERHRNEIKAAKSEASSAHEHLSEQIEILRSELAGIADSLEEMKSERPVKASAESKPNQTMIRLWS